MVHLVLVYCLIADAKSCIEKRPVLGDAFASPMACMVSAQPIAADFLREHPDYALSRFRCEINRPDERRA